MDPLGTLFSMMKKDAGLRIRVEESLRREFLAICHAQDVPAASVVRSFMRKYVSEHQQSIQPELFKKTREGRV